MVCRLKDLAEKTKIWMKRRAEWEKNRTLEIRKEAEVEDIPEEVREMFEEAGSLCLDCVYSPCVCSIVLREKRISILRGPNVSEQQADVADDQEDGEAVCDKERRDVQEDKPDNTPPVASLP